MLTKSKVHMSHKITYMIIPALFALIIGFTSNSTMLNTNISTVSRTTSTPSIKLETQYDTPFIAKNTNFYSQTEGNNYDAFFLKGMNMGLTLPDTSLSNPNIDYDVYYEWLGEMQDMNINTVRVFTIMNANFYDALYDYNEAHKDNPIWLLQGIWVDENYQNNLPQAFARNDIVIRSFEKATTEVIDILNGNQTYANYDNGEDMVYSKDVSEYVVGYILGLEWNPYFIENTNNRAINRTSYSGEYLYTDENGESFEAMLCEVGDNLIAYETEKYNEQRPIAFLNWAPTDPLAHEDEPNKHDDLVSLDTERIHATDNYQAGMFVAMDAYPYYPEFMNVQQNYIEYNNGDTYSAYLKDLQSYYSIPVLIAEFGVPSSRGKAHDAYNGMNQGNLTEEEQGQFNLSMINKIFDQNLAGGCFFSWQDEWFKQTWNVYAAHTDARFLNVQSAEQGYGIVAYEPGKDRMISYPDGDLEEWQNITPTITSDNISLSIQKDEAYLYMLIEGNEYIDVTKDGAVVALNVTDGRGNNNYSDLGLNFLYPVDYLVTYNPNGNSKMLVASNYDLNYYRNTYEWQNRTPVTDYEQLNSGYFNPIELITSNKMKVPYESEIREPVNYETGLLTEGNGNPTSPDYNSLTDFSLGDNSIEIRIPWYLLNVVDPAGSKIIDDFYANEGIYLTNFNGFYVGVEPLTATNKNVDMEFYNYEGYDTPTYHKRLKDSYWILQEGLGNIQ